jgi:hypothetical protein
MKIHLKFNGKSFDGNFIDKILAHDIFNNFPEFPIFSSRSQPLNECVKEKGNFSPTRTNGEVNEESLL